MKIQRVIPPSAVPVYLKNLLYGLAGMFFKKRYLKTLEEGLKRYFGVRHVFLVSSGTAALTLILNGLKVLFPEKKGVVIPAYTCFSVPSAISRSGLKVSLCDVDPSTLDFDYKVLRDCVSEDTLCVLPSHLFGIPSDMDRVMELCKALGVFVVEDAAQAMGGRYRKKLLGTIGDVGFFSLGRGKNITCGSGGIVVTSSDRLAEIFRACYADLDFPRFFETVAEFFKVVCLAVFIRPSLYWLPAMLSFLKLGETVFSTDFPVKRLSAMQGGLLKGWEKKLDTFNRIRRENAAYFFRHLDLEIAHDPSVAYLRLPALVASRAMKEKLCSLAIDKGLGLSPMYPSPINEIPLLRNQLGGALVPSAKAVSERLLTLPTHLYLREEDKTAICLLWQEVLAEQYSAVDSEKGQVYEAYYHH